MPAAGTVTVHQLSNSKDSRFAGQFGRELDIAVQVLPYYQQMQAKIGQQVHAYTQGTGSTRRFGVVEIGVGSGLTTMALLSYCPEVDILGIDNSEAMIKQAHVAFAKMHRRDRERVELSHGDALESLKELPDQSVDIIASGYTIHNMPPEYRAELFREIGRVVRSRGFFINGDKCVSDDPTKRAQDWNDTMRFFKTFDKLGRPDLKEEWQTHYRVDEGVRFPALEQRRLLANNGFIRYTPHCRFYMDSLVSAIRR